MIIFLRHAERGDNELPMKLSQIPHDPPIIEASSETIRVASQEIAQLMQDQGVSKFKIMSSKFLRCLMTARGVEEQLKQRGLQMSESSYGLDDRICEYLREDWFKSYPLHQLIYRSEHIEQYVPNLSTRDLSPGTEIPFPQNYVKFHSRVMDFKKSLVFPPQGECLLVFTHGFVVRQLCFHMNQVPNYANEIKYCGYAAFARRQLTDVLLKSRL